MIREKLQPSAVLKSEVKQFLTYAGFIHIRGIKVHTFILKFGRGLSVVPKECTKNILKNVGNQTVAGSHWPKKLK